MYKTPILLIVFNRPEKTKLLIEVLKNIKPQYLYIAADGPRVNNNNDEIQCKLTRDIIQNDIDWDCDVKKLYHEANKGCRNAPPTAISWFFNHVDKGLILEDDCIVDLSFFRFSEELLHFYEYDENVMHISATSTFKKVSNKSFNFSSYPLSWGWATWRRAWDKYDVSIKDWEEEKKKKELFLYGKHKNVVSYFEKRFDAVYNYTIGDNPVGGSNTWDYQWYYCLFKNNGLAIIPQLNMVKNIGFDETATHTTDPDSKSGNRDIHSLNFPLIFPKNISTKKTNFLVEKELLNINTRSNFYTFLAKTKKTLLNKFKLVVLMNVFPLCNITIEYSMTYMLMSQNTI